ncbi:helix-turn-helix transcriptional regulator [Streptomyces sp. JB150]|uniref:helix-turn-helix domain-containing protein n=1 Tax=Streptomyces sp. JB150 TaxID=2714844 RepID=UPI001408A31E|nr:helix-turn-helix transcriptional regulator [Streptomyces sp. JB150]QIJ62219.1 helix-turn-helix transcriptional regulator [Streptomyces sp. JB150]
MAHTGTDTATRHLARRVKEVRMRRGFTAQQLAEALQAQGIAWQRTTVVKLENGTRENVTLNEVLALAYVLGVAPVHLMVDPDTASPYPVTAQVSAPAAAVRSWVRGFKPLDDIDPRTFYTEVPAVEFGKREDHPDRYEWVSDMARYLSRSMGRMYRRDDGSAVLEVELPGRGNRGESGEATER